MSSPLPKKTHGSCLCKKVNYELKGDPGTFVVCYCVNCQKATGSAFMANTFWRVEALKITSGEEKLTKYHDSETTSGRTLIRTFCSDCGACLFMYHEPKTFVIVSAGTLDEKRDWVPRRESRDDCRWEWIKDIQLEPKSKSKL